MATRRIAIVFDGKHWFVRRIACIEHDWDNDEKVYRCDAPIGTGSKTLRGALRQIHKRARKTKAERGRR